MLETVAAVPGMVGATLQHLKSLRRMQNDGGWIHTLLAEAENERMHLMTFIEIARAQHALQRFGARIQERDRSAIGGAGGTRAGTAVGAHRHHRLAI